MLALLNCHGWKQLIFKNESTVYKMFFAIFIQHIIIFQVLILCPDRVAVYTCIYGIYSVMQKDGLNFVSLCFRIRTSDKYDVSYI